jgi:hypothetical protein
VQKEISVQIGFWRVRDKSSRAYSPCQPLFKTCTIKIAESMTDKIATLLVDCYQENEKSKAVENENKTA